MTDAYKSLVQSMPAMGALTDAYTVPAGKMAVVSTIVVCNIASFGATFRIKHSVAGVADADSQYLFCDTPIDAKATRGFTFGPTLAAGDVLRVYSDSGYVTFNVYGLER